MELDKRFVVGKLIDGRYRAIASFDYESEAVNWIGEQTDRAAIVRGDYYVDDRENPS